MTVARCKQRTVLKTGFLRNSIVAFNNHDVVAKTIQVVGSGNANHPSAQDQDLHIAIAVCRSRDLL